ncbi:YggU-like protein [Venustampulla echinocandica]|uniref:YggU-like protein n=1 Tax=Venustampulla echinocandica TaxID=2656787 RepID=A0A370TDI1_9HELO|nr:YggU-like protein [Venustampulla echinocandica]RDL32530.1 YggU-like protein [Venustampulla echinocandica]
MNSLPAIRHVASSSKSALGYIYLQCHVKPGASKQREGIISVSEDIIEVCVSAQAREGEANKAVREVFSDVLKCPKSDVEVVRGLKSRDKTIAISGIDVKGDEQKCISGIRDQLLNAVE